MANLSSSAGINKCLSFELGSKCTAAKVKDRYLAECDAHLGQEGYVEMASRCLLPTYLTLMAGFTWTSLCSAVIFSGSQSASKFVLLHYYFPKTL